MSTPPVVLTIAGFDPSSGAGITADIKTIAAQGCYGVACVTALTVQSTGGVRRTEAVAAEQFAQPNRPVVACLERLGNVLKCSRGDFAEQLVSPPGEVPVQGRWKYAEMAR